MNKSQVNKLGRTLKKELKKNSQPSVELLNQLQEYRISYKEDISQIFNKVSEIAKEARKDSITSFRIKRIESILSKIKRQPTMSLGNMGDIAGCRILVYHENVLSKVITELHLNFKVKAVNDYLHHSKEDGYRGYHLYIESPINSSKLIEIQVRTVGSHKWASMVEIIDIIYNLKIKEGQKHPELEKFLFLLSKKEKLEKSEIVELLIIDSKYDINKRLNEVFLKNHSRVRKDVLKVNQGTNQHFIIEVDENKISQISSFCSYENAEIKYFEKFKELSKSHFVLTAIEKPTFKRLCIAYASYVLIKHDYLEDWNYFIDIIIKEATIERKFREEKAFRDYKRENLEEQLKILKSEIKDIKEYQMENSADIYGYKEWAVELKGRIKQVQSELIRIDKEESKPSLWERFFSN